MSELIIITIVHHSDGKYRVYKDLGAWPEVRDRLDIEFATADEARAHAETIQKSMVAQPEQRSTTLRAAPRRKANASGE